MEQPLTQEERDALMARYVEGDESMICGFPFDDGGGGNLLYAYPMGTPFRDGVAHPQGAVWLPLFETDDSRCLSPYEARRMAVALLEAADHVEYGPDK